MQVTVEHPVYGQITYDENFWSGKRKIYLNSVELSKLNKLTYIFQNEEGVKEVKVKGSYLFGLKLDINGTVVQMTQPAKWYEYIASLSLFVFIMVWGNSPTLVEIFPVIGGAIGGAISGFMMYLTLALMKSKDKWYLKLLIWLGMFVANALACYIAALVFVSMIA